MKIISLMPLIQGTGICHYVSSFAMIEKEKVAILDLDRNSILEEMLKSEHVYSNDNNTNNELSKNYYHIEHFTSCFNNKVFKNTVDLKVDDYTALIATITNCLSKENLHYLIIHYPYVFQGFSDYHFLVNSDYTVFFSDSTFEAKLAMKDILNRQPNNKYGMVLTKQENANFCTIQAKEEINDCQIQLLGDIPYSLLFHLASIQNKVVLEFDNSFLSDSIINIWELIKYNTNLQSE